MSSFHKPLKTIAILFITLSSGIVFFNIEKDSATLTNPGSRYAMVEAIVDHNVFYIDNTIYATSNQGGMGTDSVKIGDYYYSSKPPMLSIITAGVYWCYKTLTKKSIRSHTNDVVEFCNLIIVGIPHILLLVYFFRLICLFQVNTEAIIISLAAISFTFLGLGYATDMNNHSPSAAVLTMGFYYAFRIRHNIQPESRHWVIAGVCFGLLPAFDIPSFIFSVAISIYLFQHHRKKFVLYFLIPALAIIGTHLVITFIATQSVMPIYLRSNLYIYEGSYWSEYNDILALLKEPKYIYAFHVLVGHHGIFTMYPTFILAFIALIISIKRRSPLFVEAIVVIISVLSMILLYIVKTKDYGGTCVGFRWLIVIMPLLFLFFGVWIDYYLRGKWPLILFWPLVIFVLSVGQYHTFDTLDTPWKNGAWHKYVDTTIDTMCCDH